MINPFVPLTGYGTKGFIVSSSLFTETAELRNTTVSVESRGSQTKSSTSGNEKLPDVEPTIF
uniref:hypothetical protein n=1 Tax=Bacteroides finegoldii TaxID=338188 RepID=UPI003569225F